MKAKSYSFAKALIISFKSPVFSNIFLNVSSEANKISTSGRIFSISTLASGSDHKFLLKFTSKETNAPPFLKLAIKSFVSCIEVSQSPKDIPLVWKILVFPNTSGLTSFIVILWNDEFNLS